MAEYQETSFFTTQNRQLAFALASAGCPLAPQTSRGPTTNTYTLGFLRQRKIGAGLGIEAAARIALKARIPGIVDYIFVRDEKLEQCIKVWDLLVAEFQDAEKQDRTPMVPDFNYLQVMQMAFVLAQNRKPFDQLPFVNAPLVSTVNSHTETSTNARGAEVQTATGSGKVWCIDASPELKNQIKNR